MEDKRSVMENFELGTVYLVGNDLLDAQHKVVLSYMAQLYAQASAGKPEKKVFELIDRLETCCKLHFLDEEGLLDEIKFTDTDKHKAQHALFMVHLENFVGRYQERETSRNLEELVFLKDWFLAHIEEFDRKYAEF